jgi:hypothetical protein
MLYFKFAQLLTSQMINMIPKNMMRENSFFRRELTSFFDEMSKDRFKGKTEMDISEELKFNIFINFPVNGLIILVNEL